MKKRVRIWRSSHTAKHHFPSLQRLSFWQCIFFIADKISNNHRLEEPLSKRHVSYKENKITAGSTALVNYMKPYLKLSIKMENSCIKKKKKDYSKSIVHIHLWLKEQVWFMLHYYFCPRQLLQSEAFSLYTQMKSVITFCDLSSWHTGICFMRYTSVALKTKQKNQQPGVTCFS